MVKKPAKLVEYEFVDGLCEKYGKLPSEVMREPAGYLMKMHKAIGLAKGQDKASPKGDTPDTSSVREMEIPMEAIGNPE